jgi:hypothetical protein
MGGGTVLLPLTLCLSLWGERPQKQCGCIRRLLSMLSLTVINGELDRMKVAKVAYFIVVDQRSSWGLKETKVWIICGLTKVWIMHRDSSVRIAEGCGLQFDSRQRQEVFLYSTGSKRPWGRPWSLQFSWFQKLFSLVKASVESCREYVLSLRPQLHTLQSFSIAAFTTINTKTSNAGSILCKSNGFLL